MGLSATLQIQCSQQPFFPFYFISQDRKIERCGEDREREKYLQATDCEDQGLEFRSLCIVLICVLNQVYHHPAPSTLPFFFFFLKITHFNKNPERRRRTGKALGVELRTCCLQVHCFLFLYILPPLLYCISNISLVGKVEIFGGEVGDKSHSQGSIIMKHPLYH